MTPKDRRATLRAWKHAVLRAHPPMELLLVMSGVNLTLAVLFLFGFFDC